MGIVNFEAAKWLDFNRFHHKKGNDNYGYDGAVRVVITLQYINATNHTLYILDLHMCINYISIFTK